MQMGGGGQIKKDKCSKRPLFLSRMETFSFRSICIVPAFIHFSALSEPVYPTDVGSNPSETSGSDILFPYPSWSALHLNSVCMEHSKPLEVCRLGIKNKLDRHANCGKYTEQKWCGVV